MVIIMNKEKIIKILNNVINRPIEAGISSERYNDFVPSHINLYNSLLETAKSNGLLEGISLFPISLDDVPSETECYDFVIGHMIVLLAILEA